VTGDCLSPGDARDLVHGARVAGLESLAKARRHGAPELNEA